MLNLSGATVLRCFCALDGFFRLAHVFKLASDGPFISEKRILWSAGGADGCGGFMSLLHKYGKNDFRYLHF